MDLKHMRELVQQTNHLLLLLQESFFLSTGIPMLLLQIRKFVSSQIMGDHQYMGTGRFQRDGGIPNLPLTQHHSEQLTCIVDLVIY